jgi:glycine betaine/proline transport system permease protein
VTAQTLPALGRRLTVPTGRRLAWIALFAGAALLYLVFQGQGTLPHDDRSPLFAWFNDARNWIDANRNANPLLSFVFGGIRAIAGWLVVSWIGLLDALGWAGVIAILGTLGYWAGGFRIAALMVAGALTLGALGFWESGMETLGLTIAAVILSLAIGVPLGVAMGRSETVRTLLTPLLDVMQIMPAFAYLAPLALFFGIGPAAAAIVTMIYAMPAAIRITAMGIRTVPATTVEAATSLGATPGQLLRKVQLPLSRRALGLAVNQTIMLALSMVVITVLINAPGLGVDILRALQRNNVGAGFDAGLAVVILAILLDRLTEQASRRMDSRNVLARRAPRRAIIWGSAAVALALVAGAQFVEPLDGFPPALVALRFQGPVNDIIAWIRSNLFFLTEALRVGFTLGLLNPLQGILVSAPWLLVLAFAAGLGTMISGVRAGIVVAVCLLGVAGLQLWEHAMETLASVLVALVITVVLGVLLGVLSARSDRFSVGLRPLLDAAQTMPAFVYLIPAVALFGATRFTAIVAAVIFAAPPVIRLVEAGIRTVPPTIIEAATSAGASSRQLLWKVQLPSSRAALGLAVNQGIIMVLGMVVVGGLVGAGALGYDVVTGFAQRSDFGKGLAAGFSLVLLGIALDRMSQGAGTGARATSDRA